MFYLKEFSKLFRSNLILSSILIFSVFGLVSSTLQKEKIKSELSLSQKTNTIPYFNALVSNKINLESIKRKMINLPGVFKVNVAQTHGLAEELGHLKKNFGQDIIGELSALNYKKLKIELEEGIHAKNQELVREYLSRLVGKESLTMGAVKTPRNINLKKDDSLLVFAQYADIYLTIFFMALMAICVLLLMKPLNNQAYIIEKFQRKTKVNIKVLMSGVSCIGLVSFAVNYLYNSEIKMSSMAVLAYILILPVIFLMSKKLSYKV